jgi:DNA repair protein RecO
MYQIHVTDGIVLQKRAVGEGSARVAILTRELGLVRARAQSARAEKSKLRYGLELLTRARFSLVKGKQEWRLTGVEGGTRLVSESLHARAAAGRVSALLLRLVAGQEYEPHLFETVSEGLQTLMRTGEKEEAEAVEVVLVLRTLAHLGYLPHTPELAPFISTDFASLELSQAALRSKRLLIKAINESLQASGL